MVEGNVNAGISSLPLPIPDTISEYFWKELQSEHLVIQHCPLCETLYHPPRVMCHTCGGFDFDWIPMSGKGTVFSYVITHQPVHPALEGKTPFITVDIQLDEGPHVISNLFDIEVDEVEIGLPVIVNFRHINDDVTLPVFRQFK
jgi:hypothetical protein